MEIVTAIPSFSLRMTVVALAVGPMLTVAATQQKVELKVSSGTLHGTLGLPDNPAHKPYPVVLLIAGSGPTDRNGNSRIGDRHADSYRLLADALAARGIASLRYDKRGIGESHSAMASESQLQFHDFVDDAVGWGRLLRADARFSSLTIAGHSEGSLIGIMAAKRLPADALVSLEGAGEPISRIMERQLQPQIPPDLYQQAQAIIRSLERGERVNKVPPELAMLFRPSVQPLDISWFRLDPRKEISQLSIPILIVQGQQDEQMSLTDARQLQQVNPRARLLVLPKMNHLLKDNEPSARRDSTDTHNANAPLDESLAPNIAAFIHELPVTKEKGQ